MEIKTMNRRVRFAKKNDTHWIERRGENRLSKNQIDDEVKDHPVFSAIQRDSTPAVQSPSSVLSPVGYAQEIETQIEQDPERKTLINPISQRTITRFGTSYWSLIQTVFGSKSPFYAKEKETYRKLYKK